MAQGNFNHLPDLSDLPGQAPYILIGDIPHMQRQLLQGLTGYADDGLRRDQHCTSGHGADHGQVEAVVDHLHPQHLSFDQSSSLQHSQKISRAAHEPDGAGGGYHDLPGRPGFGPRDGHLAVYSHSQVGPGVAVDSDQIVRILRVSRPDNGIELVLALDLHHAAVLQGERGHCRRSNPGHTFSCVLMIGLCDPQLNTTPAFLRLSDRLWARHLLSLHWHLMGAL